MKLLHLLEGSQKVCDDVINTAIRPPVIRKCVRERNANEIFYWIIIRTVQTRVMTNVTRKSKAVKAKTI